MVQTTILVKMTFFRTGFYLAFTRPKWTKMVHFGLKNSILVHLAPPTVLWPALIEGPTRKPRDTLAFLARTPTRKRFPDSTAYDHV